jgi:hypothetical protein
MTLAEFFNQNLTLAEIKQISKDLGYTKKVVNALTEVSDEFAVDIIQGIEDIPEASAFFIESNDIDEDRDHGAWTKRYILFASNEYYAADVEFFGQGDTDAKKINLKRVKPKDIVVTIFEEIND